MASESPCATQSFTWVQIGLVRRHPHCLGAAVQVVFCKVSADSIEHSPHKQSSLWEVPDFRKQKARAGIRLLGHKGKES